MSQYFCHRCREVTTSVEGPHCYQCHTYEFIRNKVTENFPSPVPKYGNSGPGYYVEAASAEKSVKDVRKYLCLRCLEITTSIEGPHCYQCDKDESMKNDVTTKIPSLAQKPGNVGYPVSAADENVEKSAVDMRKYLCLRCLEVTTSNEGPHCYQCDKDESLKKEVAADFHSSSPKHGNIVAGCNAQVANAEKSVEDVREYLCLRCLEVIISVEGPHCYQCDEDEYLKNEVIENFLFPARKSFNSGPGYHVQSVDENAEKSVEDVREYLCLRCFEAIKFFEGLHCYQCDKDEYLKNEATANFRSPAQKPENAVPEDRGQTADANAQRPVGYLILIEPTPEASIHTTDNDFVLLIKPSEYHGPENDTKKSFSVQGESSQIIDHETSVKQNNLPWTPDANRKDFHDKFPLRISTIDPKTFGIILETMYEPQSSSHRTHFREKSFFDENGNSFDSDAMLRRQGNMDPKQHVNEAGKLDFAYSSLSRSENPVLSFSQDSSSNPEEKEKVNLVTSDLVSDRRRTRKRQHSPDLLSSSPKKSIER